MNNKKVISILLAASLGASVGSYVTSVKYEDILTTREVEYQKFRKKHIEAANRSKEHSKKLSTLNKEQYNIIEELKSTNEDLLQQVKNSNRSVGTYSIGNFVLTSYSPYDNVSGIENDGNPNVTSTGTKPKDGTIAVDPSVIPYGSKIIILYPDGSIERGRAEDCGGAIKGNRLDVFRWTYKEASSFGRREATVIWYK